MMSDAKYVQAAKRRAHDARHIIRATTEAMLALTLTDYERCATIARINTYADEAISVDAGL
jgi:hypothetical protein